MSTVVQRTPYLRAQRTFPDEAHALSVELSKSYIDIANNVNARTIGIFPINVAAVTGETFYGNDRKPRQTLRQVYVFTNTAPINHGILVSQPGQFTSCYGSYTDGTNDYGLIFGTPVAIAGQISFYVTPTQIVFAAGAGAPALTFGRIILQWLSIAQIV
jgi:hypothetical protein